MSRCADAICPRPGTPVTIAGAGDSTDVRFPEVEPLGRHRFSVANRWGSLPIVATLAEPDAGKLRELTDAFLRTKSIEGAGGFELDDESRVVVAAQSCIPILALGIDAYTGWRSVVVYPGGFMSRGTSVDESGIEHEWEEARSGESWFRGPVVLSWEDVVASGRLEGYNVVIHEMAHKLDSSRDATASRPCNAGMDGGELVPVFARREDWTLDRGREDRHRTSMRPRSGRVFVGERVFFEAPRCSSVLPKATPTCAPLPAGSDGAHEAVTEVSRIGRTRGRGASRRRARRSSRRAGAPRR